jgi:hypothetical protein
MRGLAVLLCLFVGMFSAGCAGKAPPQVPASSTPATDTSTPSVPAPPTPSSVPLTTTPTRASEPGITVRGTVSAGTEAGCLILDTGTAQYLLLGADPAIAVAGAEVEVTGRAEPGAMTTCQQGTPFHVQKTQRAGR